MPTLIDVKKAVEKIQHPFLMKILNKLWVEGKYINIIKAIYDKSIANIAFNSEKLKSFSWRSGTRQGCQLYTNYVDLVNIVLEVVMRAISQEKEIKRHPNCKGRNTTVSICRWLGIIYRIPDSTKKPVRTNEWIHESCRIRNQHTKISCISYIYNELSEKEIRRTILFTVASERMK